MYKCKFNFSMRSSVCWSVGLSVCHNFLSKHLLYFHAPTGELSHAYYWNTESVTSYDNPSRPSVGWSVDLSVRQNLSKGRKVTPQEALLSEHLFSFCMHIITLQTVLLRLSFLSSLLYWQKCSSSLLHNIEFCLYSRKTFWRLVLAPDYIYRQLSPFIKLSNKDSSMEEKGFKKSALEVPQILYVSAGFGPKHSIFNIFHIISLPTKFLFSL